MSLFYTEVSIKIELESIHKCIDYYKKSIINHMRYEFLYENEQIRFLSH